MEGLKALIRERLHSNPAVIQALEEHPELREDPGALLDYLEKHGLVEDLFESLETSLQQAPSAIEVPRAADQQVADKEDLAYVGGGAPNTQAELSSSFRLSLRLSTGRAFLDFLEDPDASSKELVFHLFFGRHRCRSRPVRAEVDPLFEETFDFDLPPRSASSSSSSSSSVTASSSSPISALLTLDQPVHMLLVCQPAGGGGEHPWDNSGGVLLASHRLEWRHVLSAAGTTRLTVELQGVGRRRQLSIGVLHGEISLRQQTGPQIGRPGDPFLQPAAVNSQIAAEERLRADSMRRTFEGLDRWWSSYAELYKGRNVRLFAQTECSLYLPVTSFVTPMEAGRTLDSPTQALRFVSLFGASTTSTARDGEGRWHTFPAIWALGRATLEEKALLLTSLLLGYSFDAWCALGLDAKGAPHAWVVVRGKGDFSLPADITCWEVATGLLIRADDQRYLSTYTSIDTLFNHRYIYVCHANSVARTSFDLRNNQHWLPVPLEPSATTGCMGPTDVPSPESLRLYPSRLLAPFSDLRPQVFPPTIEAHKAEAHIESTLASTLRTHRSASGLATKFDDHLAELLQVGLAHCEQQRSAGVPASVGSAFEDIVRRYCAAEEVFHAVPVQFNHLQVGHYWPLLFSRPTVRQLLAAPAATTSFAIRVRIVFYPEGRVASWVLLAAIGRSRS